MMIKTIKFISLFLEPWDVGAIEQIVNHTISTTMKDSAPVNPFLLENLKKAGCNLVPKNVAELKEMKTTVREWLWEGHETHDWRKVDFRVIQGREYTLRDWMHLKLGTKFLKGTNIMY